MPAVANLVPVGRVFHPFPKQMLRIALVALICLVLLYLFSGSSAGASVLSGMSTALSVGGSGSAIRRGVASKKSEGLRTARWVKRQLLTRAPKTAEEIALDDKEVRGRVLFADHRRVYLTERLSVGGWHLPCDSAVGRRLLFPRQKLLSRTR